MQGPWTIQTAIWALNFLGTALVIWRLHSQGLHRTYRLFFAGFCFSLARTAALLPFSITDAAYYWIWVLTQPLLWLSYLLIVIELYSLVLKNYPGVRSLGRWFSIGAVGVSLAVALATVLPTVSRGTAVAGRPKLMYYYAYMERGVATSLGIVLILLIIAMAWFAVPTSRNLRIHCSVYTAYFLAQNVVLLYWHLAGQSANRNSTTSSIARMSVALVCYCCWAALLTERGEKGKESLSLGRSPEYERQMLGQLEKLNATLLHVAKK
jgi:hypothetical protein